MLLRKYIKLFSILSTEIVAVATEGLFKELHVHHIDEVGVLDYSGYHETWSDFGQHIWFDFI